MRQNDRGEYSLLANPRFANWDVAQQRTEASVASLQEVGEFLGTTNTASVGREEDEERSGDRRRRLFPPLAPPFFETPPCLASLRPGSFENKHCQKKADASSPLQNLVVQYTFFPGIGRQATTYFLPHSSSFFLRKSGESLCAALSDPSFLKKKKSRPPSTPWQSLSCNPDN